MKTRQKKNDLAIVQTTVWGISDGSPSTPLTNTKRSQKQRKDIYSNKSLHMELKKKISLRMKLKVVENALRRTEDPDEPERYRKKEREKKRKQCFERKKTKEAATQKLTTPVKRKVKNLEQKLRKKYMELSQEKSSKKGALSSQVTPKSYVVKVGI